MKTSAGSSLAQWRALLLLGLLIGVSVSCRPESRPESPSPAAHDSAGVVIAEIGGDPWATPEWAILDTVNELRISPRDSVPATIFGRVRDAIRLADGRIALLDDVHHELRVFDSVGTHLVSFGREGPGPGEYLYPMRLFRGAGDSILVYDGLGFVDQYSRDVKLGRRFKLAEVSFVASELPVGRFADGSFLMAERRQVSVPSPPRTRTLHSHSFYVLTEAGVKQASLGSHEGLRVQTFPVLNGTRTQSSPPLFFSLDAFAFLSNGYVWCDTEEFRCEIWSRSGRLERIIRAAPAMRAVTDADVESLQADKLTAARTEVQRSVVRAAFQYAERPRFHPVLSAIRTDASDRIWIQEDDWPEDRNYEWLVLDLNGTPLGRITLPAELRVLELGADYILGMEESREGVEQPVMYRYRVHQRRVAH